MTWTERGRLRTSRGGPSGAACDMHVSSAAHVGSEGAEIQSKWFCLTHALHLSLVWMSNNIYFNTE